MRYLLFGNEVHYPSGGARDFIKASDDLYMLRQLALKRFKLEFTHNTNNAIEWWHIFDITTMVIIDDQSGESQ